MPATTVLYRDSQGPQVIYLQAILKLLGYYKGEVNGSFGTITEHSVKQFQADSRFPINGVVDKKTWVMIRKAIQRKGLPIELGTPYGSVPVPWWLLAILGGFGIFGAIEVALYLWRKGWKNYRH